MPFLYEHFDQLIFYDLLVFGNERKFSNDGSHEFIKNYPDPENKITLIEETDLSGITPLGAGNEIKCKMFSYGSKFVRDDMDVFWCTDMDEFFKEELISEVESVFKRSVNSIGTKFYNFYKTTEFLLTNNKELCVNPTPNSSVRIIRHQKGNKYGHCDGAKYRPINLTTKNALYHLSWIGEKRVREKFSYYKDNPVTGFVSVKYIKEWEEFSEAKFNVLNKKGFYGNPFVGPGRFERTQVTRCPFDIFEELPYLNKTYFNSLILTSNYEKPQITINKPAEEKVSVQFGTEKEIPNPISIIITAYQSENFIEECLDSIENQTYFSNNHYFEVLVGIDGCQNTLNKLLQIRYKYRNLRIFMMDSNMGTYVTTNTLLDIVKYENIIRFDSDDIMLPEMVREIVNNIDESENLLIRFGFYKLTNGIIRENAGKSQYAHGAIYAKKTIYDKLGGYQAWMCAADTELLERGKHIINEKLINKPLFNRRYHDNSLTRSNEYGMNSEKRKQYSQKLKMLIGIKINKVVNEFKEY